MLRLSPDHFLDIAEHSIVFVANTPPSPAHLAQLEAALRAEARSRPAGIGYLHHILDRRGRGTVDEPTRAAFVAMVRRSGHLIASAALVVPRQGFAGAAMRSVVSGVILAARPPFPARVFSKIPEATRWLSSSLGQRAIKADAALLAMAAEALETELAKAPASD